MLHHRTNNLRRLLPNVGSVEKLNCVSSILFVVLELTFILVQRVERLLSIKSKKTNLCVMIRAYRKPRLIVLAFFVFILKTF